MNIVNMEGIKRKGKLLMGSSDLSFVIYEQKCLHEAQAKVLPCHSKVSTALLKWSYTESNASIPNLYSCWSDLDYAQQMLTQEAIDQSVEYRKVFKDINAEGKRLSEIQKEKESSAKKVSAIKKQIENLKKSKKGADKVKQANLEAELALAVSKDTEMGKLVICKTKEFEEYKATHIRDASLSFCDSSLETLDRMRQVIVAKREVVSSMSPNPIYNGDQVSQDGVSTVEDVFRALQMQLPPRDGTLDRSRCFGLGTRTSSFSHSLDSSSNSSIPPSPQQSRTLHRASPPSIPSNPSPSLGAGRRMHGSTPARVYQGGNDMGISDESDEDHDYQIPNEEYFGKGHNTSLEGQEEEYLAPQLSELPLSGGGGPRVPPRQESLTLPSDPNAGTSKIPGDYMVVIEDTSDLEEARMPPGHSRSSTDSSASSGSTGIGKATPVRLPRVLPSNNSFDGVEGEDFCWRDRKNDVNRKEKEAAMLKRKPAPLPKPALDIKPKPKPKPKPASSPGRDKPMPIPRNNSTEQETVADQADDSGGLYEDMNAGTSCILHLTKNGSAILSTYEPEPEPGRGVYYSQVYERDSDDAEDSDGDYCVADFSSFQNADVMKADAVGRTSAKPALNNNMRQGSEGQRDGSADNEDEDEAIYCNLPT
ncbi:uncharacterized protein [Diadema antillarum]|uniref:uncharacterized protein n=1 Tax=Diadema antillarum TaxID=105358 RepID=UPI003A84B59C